MHEMLWETMSDVWIFEFDDYRSWLRSVLDAKTRKNKAFSLSHLARKIDVSQSMFSLIVHGKRRLSEKNAERLAGYLRLTARETAYLMLLLQREVIRDRKQRSALQRELDELRKQAYVARQAAERERPLSPWACCLVLAATDLTSIDRSAAGLSAYLGIDNAQIAPVLRLLTELRLVRAVDGEYHFHAAGVEQLPADVSSHSQWKISQAILQKAQAHFSTKRSQVGLIHGRVLATSEAQVALARQKIAAFVAELDGMLRGESLPEAEAKRDVLVQYSIQLFDA